MQNIFLVCVEYVFALSLVVTPQGSNFGGNTFLIIACHFARED